MAGTVATGYISTEEIVPDERVVDMDPKIRVLKPDDTQFTTMTDKVSSRAATREKVNWLEEEDFPRIVTNTAAQITTDTAIPFSAGHGKLVQPNDVLRNMRSGEACTVVSVATDTITLARGVGRVVAAAISASDNWLVVADAQPQGSDFPVARYLARVLGYNYTQITRTPWTFTNTQTAIELYGGREPAKEAVRQARVHKKKWEAIGFWGTRSYVASSVAPNGNTEPQGMAGGLYEFLQSNKLDCAGAAMTPSGFDNLMAAVFQYGSTNKVLFAAPVVVQCMSSWNRSGMGAQWDPTPRNVYGVNVDAFISGAYGYRIPVVVKKEFGEFPVANKGFGSYAFLVDLDYIERRPLRDRDTKLLTEQQPKGRDSYAAEYICEATWEIAHERAHAWILGAIAP